MGKWRRIGAVVVGMVLLSACRARVSVYGDSNTNVSKAALAGAFAYTSGYGSEIFDRPGCGLVLNQAVQCAGGADWPALVAKDLADGPPDYVVVELGYNDAVWDGEAYVRENAASLIAQWVSLWPPGTPIVWVNLAYFPALPQFNAAIDAFNDALAADASVFPNLQVVDLHDDFLPHGADYFSTTDFVHYTSDAQREFAWLSCSTVENDDPGGVTDTCRAYSPPTTTTTTTTTVPDTTTTTVPDTTTTTVPDTTTTTVPDTTTTTVPDTTTTEPGTTTTTDTTDTTLPSV